MPVRRRSRKRTVAVFIDLSHDRLAARGLVRLEPDDIYHTTENRVPLRAARLRKYDALVIAGHIVNAYSPREVDAIVQFVKAGGGLLLAASAGVFERYTGRQVGEMAVAAVGRRCGIEFLSPGEATGKVKTNANLVEGYPRESVRLHRGPATRGLSRNDVRLEKNQNIHSARIACPPEPCVLERYV